MANYIIGVDLGGTRLRSALLDEDLNILHRHEELTLAHEGVDATLPRVLNAVRMVLPSGGGAVEGVGISIPGPTNPFTGVVELGTNLKGWMGVPLARIVEEEFELATYLGNDANVAALAETALGSARGSRHVIYITVSTGIGGGVIVDGRMLLGKEGYAAEIGHIQMVVDGRETTLEKEAAGPALARKARDRIKAGAKSIMNDMVEGQLEKISGKTVGKAASAGDALALDIVARAARVLGLGVTTLLHIFNPEVVVFGGGVAAGLGEMLLTPVRETVVERVIDDAYYRNLRYETAALGENVSIIGAGALVATRGGVEDVRKAAKKLSE